MRLLLSLPAAFLTAAVAIPAENWPAFRGPNGDGTTDATGVPTQWSETSNIRWKTAIHGKGWSSPVVWGNQVWVTTADEVPRSKKVPLPKRPGSPGNAVQATYCAVCIDRDTGKIVHDVKLRVEKDPDYCHDYNSYASPTPVIEDGRVYAHFGSHGTWCIDTATGQPLWERTDLECNHFRGPGSSPILYKDLLILILDGYDYQYVAALDKKTGRTVWKKDRDINYSRDDGDLKKAYATARVLDIGGRPHLVCPSAEFTIAYDPMTGEELWRLKHGGMNGAARPIRGNGLLFLTSGHTKQLLAVKENLNGHVPRSAIVWQTREIVPTRPSLLLAGDLLFMVNDDGIASCLDAKTGKVHWTERLNGKFSASPVLADGNIYFANDSGKTTVLKASRQYEEVAVNELESGCMASPAIAGSNLILRTRTHLYCIGK